MIRLSRVLLALLALSAPVRSEAQSQFDLYPPLDATIVGTSIIGSMALSTLDPTKKPWDHELIDWTDSGVRGSFAPSASVTSDILLATLIIAPLVGFAGYGFDEELGLRSLVYLETHSVALLLNSVVKRAVSRPRPFTYSSTTAAETFPGDDPWLSFYSGHSSAAFVSAVAGSILISARATTSEVPVLTWGMSLAGAGLTAGLRVRAGKHFPSDVLVGAVVGASLGIAIPWMQLRAPPDISAEEVISAAGGLAVGVALAWVLPFENVNPTLSGVSVVF